MKNVLLRWLLNAVGLLVILGLVNFVLPDSIRAEGFRYVLLFVLVLGLLNAIIRPVLKLLTLPLSCLTFGLFGIVINLFVFYLAFRFTGHFDIAAPPEGVEAVVLAYVGMTIVSGFVNHILRKED